jgi:hypothetical protein
MALYQYQVQYGATYATMSANTASNVQNVQFNYGRRLPLDQYSAETANITLRYPNGYTSPEALFVTGTFIRIMGRLGTSNPYAQLWVGRINNVTVQYGIPYVSNVGNADFVNISCEGALAEFGRLQGFSYAMAAGELGVQLVDSNAQTALSAASYSGYGDEVDFPATTITGTWADWINSCALTMNGRITDIGSGIVISNAFFKLPATFGNFSDTTNDYNNHIYNQIEFSSLADNFYTQVTVDPESFSPATVSTGSAPFRTYQVNTLNASTAQATDYANYLLSTYKTQALRIMSITCSLNAQSIEIPRYAQGYIASQVSVLFRGTTFQCTIEGGTWSGTPESASATFYLSSRDLSNYLILNDAVYGKLDENKLGY